MSRSDYDRLSLAALILTIMSGVLLQGPSPALAMDGPAMANFHFFEEPPQANDMELVTVGGQKFNLSDLRGKVVLLNFWRQNCRHCRREKTYLKDLRKTVQTDDLLILCIDLWDKPSWIKKYAKEDGGGLVFAFAPEGTESVMENVVKGRMLGYFVLSKTKEAIYEIKGFPSTYVIDREGKVIAAHLGMAVWNDLTIVTWLSQLVAVGSAPYSPADAYYDLPDWMDELLSGPLNRDAGTREVVPSAEAVGAQR